MPEIKFYFYQNSVFEIQYLVENLRIIWIGSASLVTFKICNFLFPDRFTSEPFK
jgi:hypothetical protein